MQKKPKIELKISLTWGDKKPKPLLEKEKAAQLMSCLANLWS